MKEKNAVKCDKCGAPAVVHISFFGVWVFACQCEERARLENYLNRGQEEIKSCQ